MSLRKLTENLENFQWTDYSKTGTGKSPQQDGTPYFERPNPKSLEQMESKFGKLDTPPGTRGPYDTVDYMDGTKQGRGFIPPGSTPVGFDKDMDLIYSYDRSRLVLNGDISRLPLSHNVAGMNSALSYGIVSDQTLNLEPAAAGAWGNSTLPISTYTSRLPIENMPVGEVGGNNTYYGNLDISSGRRSQFQKEDGSYSPPTGDEFTKPGSGYLMNFVDGRTFPSFDAEKTQQRSFVVPAAYPLNSLAFSIDGQIASSWSSPLLESSGYGIGSEEAGLGIYDSFPVLFSPSNLELKFEDTYSESDNIWPYHVLSYFNPNTTGPHGEDHHPIIRKEIGQRYQIGGVGDWMALQVSRTLDDIDRIHGFENDEITGWLETPAGDLWIQKQNILQALNPREETRDWNMTNLKFSLAPLFHAKRHGGLFGGGTYMEEADFGNVLETYEKDAFGQGLLDKLDKVAGALGHIDFNAAHGRLNYLTGRFIEGSGTSGDSFFSFSNPFNKDKATGKSIDEPNFTVGAGHLNLTDILNGATPFGRPPKIPTQTTFSQRGAFGSGPASEGGSVGALDSAANSMLHRYKTLSYGQLGKKYSPFDSPFPSHGRGEKFGAPDPLDAVADTEGGVSERKMESLEWDFNEARRLYKKDQLTISDLNKSVKEYIKQVKKLASVNDKIGHPGKQNSLDVVTDTLEGGSGLGVIKKNLLDTGSPGEHYKSIATDKVNIHPYGPNDLDKGTDDFIKFKFYDTVNKKYIIFRAILSGISDSISPEWSGTRYIGRPDQVYVYQGVERSISFSFDVYPKTKQEFPVLMEKLNYLIGLCYPSYHNNRMIPPFINLTLGDMFNKTPGFLNSLSLEVDDVGTWEIENGLQFPKHITCQCEFQYIGAHPQITTGKHYDLGWIPTDAGEAKWSDKRWWPDRKFNDGDTFNATNLFETLGQKEDNAEIT